MDAATIQARIYQGYGKAALRIGTLQSQYRPSNASNPLATLQGTLYASFNAEDMSYGKPNKYGNPTWYGVFDGRTTQAGDYLVGAQGTFFIAAQQLNLPILCVGCNRSIRVIRSEEVSGVGAVGYRGACEESSVDVLGSPGANATFGTGWPASVLMKGRAEPTGTGLPGATKNSGWQVLLPPSTPITLQASDILLDDLGRRYAVQSSELTDLGWRLQVVEEHA